MDFSTITHALHEDRYETVRRLCEGAFSVCPADQQYELLQHWHTACRWLGDRAGCERVIELMRPHTDNERLEVLLLRAGDYVRFSTYDFYRTSAEGKQGYSGDEYQDQMLARASRYFDEAKALAQTPEQRRRIAHVLRGCRWVDEAEKLSPVTPAPALLSPTREGAGEVVGTLTFPDGTPVAGATVTLGLQVQEATADPVRYAHLMESKYRAAFSRLETLAVSTDTVGHYRFTQVPNGRHEFLAVNLDPERHAISLRFFAQHFLVKDQHTLQIDAVIDDWQSAEAQPVTSPFPEEMVRDGVRYIRLAEDVLRNPFRFYFHRQAVEMALPAGHPVDPATLLLLSSDDLQTPYPFQLREGALLYFTDLTAEHTRFFALYQAVDGAAQSFLAKPDLAPVADAAGTTAVVNTGAAAFRVPYGSGSDAVPPLIEVRGADGVWRGRGRFVLPDGIDIVRRETQLLEQGPLQLRLAIIYTLSTGAEYRWTLTFHRGESYVLVHEVSPDIEGAAFEFSLAEFLGGRGYLHWKREGGSIHWSDLTAQTRLLARLEETVPWWCPPEGFGYAMTPGGLDQQDFLGVFTIRRGEWIDRKFAAIAAGPGDDNRELDWPQPEMVGSTISMITANTTPDDALFRFRFFDGERHWGLLVSTLAANDGAFKEISAVQHKNSSPRLQDFKHWQLDRQDTLTRPCLLFDRQDLPMLRKRTTQPEFAGYWERITSGAMHEGGQGRPARVSSFQAVLEGDPVAAWYKKRELVETAHPHARSILLGRDFGDEYSPVAARAIAPWTEDFDLIVATGVFTPDEERLVRAHLMLMGHMYMETDFTNWRFNARNANFEADRADTVGIVGLCFRDNPDGQACIAHAIGQLTKMLEIYCTPGSGRWYENLACYYLQSLRCWTNLAIHLARHGHLDPASVPRMKEFLSWGIISLTAPTPAEYADMRDGVAAADYRQVKRVRRLPPFGDHGHLGAWVPDHVALMAHFFREQDPEFADFLRWAYHAGGANGGYFSNPHLFFAQADELDIVPPEREFTLASRRLEGFGVVFRGNFNQENEFYLLVKQGPGGYRYHRSEGSIILCADGKPLIYDGGEAGEAWRHTTLSFYDTHTMLAPGHVERFYTFPVLDFSQGVHPLALPPGEPDYLCNDCRHELVELAFQRYHEPNPADARSVIWVKDEYVILHDELHLDPAIPTHWHLQAVAEGESGDLASGFRFTGRFGTDLQVLLPGVQATATSVQYVPIVEPHLSPDACFGMRHLQVNGVPGTEHYLAVIRPLPAGKTELQAAAITHQEATVGVRVSGEGVADSLFFRREGIDVAADGIAFSGRYGAVLKRPDGLALMLLDGTRIATDGIALASDGAAGCLTITDHSIVLEAEGAGELTVDYAGKTYHMVCAGGRQRWVL